MLSYYQATSPTLKYLVIVGDDLMIPFRRVPDSAFIANESLYVGQAGLIPDNPTHAALDLGYILTDDFYGDPRPFRWRGRGLYVPDLAIGRLVESPDEIIATINDKALMYLEAPVRRVSSYDVVTPYFGREMAFIPSVGRIRRAIEETIDF